MQSATRQPLQSGSVALKPEVESGMRREDPPRGTKMGATATETAWITPRQAAAYLGVGVDTIYAACAAADLRHVKLGYRTIRLRREWIDRWAEKHATPAD
jgi:excisionase family DNA binding protein